MVDIIVYDNRDSKVIHKGNVIFSILPPDKTFKNARIALTMNTGYNIVISIDRWMSLMDEFDEQYNPITHESQEDDEDDKPT